jgi:hypothetical protein
MRSHSSANLVDMRKEAFLRAEWERINGSGDFVWSEWRNSYERFRDDLWDMTPMGIGDRFLAVRDKTMGFTRGNVEWHYPAVRLPTPVKIKRAAVKPKKPRKVTPAERQAAKKAAELADKEERRQRLADEFKKWERLRGNSAA